MGKIIRYSQEEILDEVKLFSPEAIKEEQDQRLKYLHFLRDFKKNNKQWYEKIKKMPLKSRVTRTALEPTNAQTTVVFLKTSKKFEFYTVEASLSPTPITPVEAFQRVEALPEEKSITLPDFHHQHVEKALTHFNTQEYKIMVTQEDPEALGGVAQRAKKFLAEIIKHPKLSPAQRKYIPLMIHWIDTGKYTNLPTEVDRLQKKKLKNLIETLQELDKIAQKYDLGNQEQEEKETSTLEKPMLILSESFV